jgi:ADP-ribose pyrophosphatase
MPRKFDNISSIIIAKNPYWEYRLDEYIKPDLSKGEYHYVWTPGSTFIIPMMNDDLFVMTRQWRYLNCCESIEFPGGGIAPGLSPEDNALKELAEETGFSANEIMRLGEFNPFNGVTNELCQVFIAKGLKKVDSVPDDSEEFEVLILSSNEIIYKIKMGEIWDGMTLAAWAMYIYKK